MSEELQRFGLTDDITLCPQCQWRTEFEETGGPHGEERHTCLNPACGFVFLGFFDPEDFSPKGNFIDGDDLNFARETLGPDATDDEVQNLAGLRADRDIKEWLARAPEGVVGVEIVDDRDEQP